MYYSQKIVVSGSIIELYQYDRLQKKDYTIKKKKKIRGQLKLDLDKPKIKRMDSVNRTRTVIRRLINSNPDLNKFVTLTFKGNVTDVTLANRCFSKFIMRLKYRYPDIKYIAVIEFQRRGAVHYHLLMDIPFIDIYDFQEIWGYGGVDIKRIDHIQNVGAYIAKYLSKDTIDERMWNKKKFFCSQNLNTPLAFFDNNEIENIKKVYDLDDIEPVYKSQFDNEYTGIVEYKQFDTSKNQNNIKI